MEAFDWIANNWIILLNAVGIVGGLLFTGASFRSEAKTRRVGNLIRLTQAHREIWTELNRNPRLSRVLNQHADVAKQPPNEYETAFVMSVILHLFCSYYAVNQNLVINPEGLRDDIKAFLSLPIPANIWARTRRYQNRAFVEFVDAA